VTMKISGSRLVCQVDSNADSAASAGGKEQSSDVGGGERCDAGD